MIRRFLRPSGRPAPEHRLPRRVLFAEDAVGRFGGVETLLRTLAPALQEQGIRTDFISHLRPCGPPPAPGKTFWLAPDAQAPRWRELLRRARRRLFFARLGPQDAVVLLNETVAADLLPDLAARRSSSRPAPFTALQFHSRFGSAWHRAGDATLRRAAEQTEAFIALTPEDAQAFADQYGQPVACIPNPLPLPVAGRAREHRPSELLCVARLAPEKQVDWVLRAFEDLAKEFPDWGLSICGAGPEGPALEQLRRELPHGGRIRFLGEQDPAGLVQAYDRAGLLALASRFEGTPMVLAEAGARGVPVVCTPSSPAVQAVCHRAGYLSGQDFPSFRETLRRAMGDAEESWRTRSEAGRQAAREQSQEQVAQQWLQLLSSRDPRSIAHALPAEPVPAPAPPPRLWLAMDSVGQLGGIGTVVQVLARALRQAGAEVGFVSREAPSGPLPVPGPLHVLDPHVGVTALNPLAREHPGPLGLKLAAKSALTPPYRLWRDRRNRRFVRGLGPRDTLVAMTPGTLRFLLPAVEHARAHGPAPQLMTQFHMCFDSAWREQWQQLLQHAARSGDAFVALNPWEAQDFADWCGVPVASVLNPLALPVAEQPRTVRPTELVCVTRLSPDKRVHWMMQAFDAVAADFPDWRLSVYGEGEEMTALRQLRERLPHGHRIRLQGRRSHEELLQVYDGAGLQLLASPAEGHPMSLVEGAARGVPAVATPACRAVIDLCTRAGYLAEDSLESFTATLRRALQDSVEQWRITSDAGRAYAQDFSPELAAQAWMELARTGDPQSVAHAQPASAASD